MLKSNTYQEYFFQHTYKIDWIYKPKLHSRCNKNASTAFLNLKFSRARSPEPKPDPPPTTTTTTTRASVDSEKKKKKGNDPHPASNSKRDKHNQDGI